MFSLQDYLVTYPLMSKRSSFCVVLSQIPVPFSQEPDQPAPSWSERVVAFSADPARPDGSLVFQQEASLDNLQSAAVYQAIVTAENRHGWSQAGDAFRFSTLGASEYALLSRWGLESAF